MRLGAEVPSRVLGCLGSADEFIENRPKPFDLTFPEMEHLHRVRVELGGEVAGCIAVGDQVEVLQEQMLDQVVGVSKESRDDGVALRLVANNRGGSHHNNVAHTDRLDLARAVNEERTVTDHNKAHAVECTGLHSAARGQRSYSDRRKGCAHGSVSRSMAVGVVSRIS